MIRNAILGWGERIGKWIGDEVRLLPYFVSFLINLGMNRWPKVWMIYDPILWAYFFSIPSAIYLDWTLRPRWPHSFLMHVFFGIPLRIFTIFSWLSTADVILITLSSL